MDAAFRSVTASRRSSITEPGTPFSNLAIGLLIFAGLLETYTFRVAWREIGGMAGLKGARTNTTVLAVLLEDSVALLGIAITLFVAFWSRLVEPAPRMDAIISIVIGLLLGTMAIALAKLNKEVLIDLADLGINAEIERAIRERAGIDLKVVSSLMDSEHCLLFVHVAPETLPEGRRLCAPHRDRRGDQGAYRQGDGQDRRSRLLAVPVAIRTADDIGGGNSWRRSAGCIAVSIPPAPWAS